MNSNGSQSKGDTLEQETHLSEHGVRALFEMSQAFAKAESEEHIYELAVQGCLRALGAGRASILIYDEDKVMRFRAFHGLSDEYRRKVEGHSPWKPSDRNPQPVLIEDVKQAGLGDLEPVVVNEGIRSLAFIPLVSGGKLLGKFMVYFDREHHFLPKELELAQAIAGQIVFAIERSNADVARNRMAAIVESSYDGIISKTLDGTITSWNGAAEQMFGYKSEEIVGKSITAIIPADRMKEEEKIIADLRQGKKIDHYETVRRRKDGSEIHVSITVSPVKNAAGEVIGASKIARDISARLQASEALRSSQLNLQVVTDAMSAPVTRCSKDLRYIWVSRQYAAWLKRPVEDFAGKPIKEIIGDEAFKRLTPYFERVLSGETVHYEEAIEYEGIGQRWVSVTYTPTISEKGKTDGWVAVVLDVTEQKESERRKDEFLATLAHELRNPLAPIRNAAFLLRSQESKTPELETIGGILDRQIDQMIRLVDDLMDVSRITRGRILLRKEMVDMNDIIRSAVESVEPLILESNHKLTVSAPGLPIRLYGDQVRLSQIIANMLNNAAKYTEPGGEITLAATKQNGDAAISVKDNGIGIEPDQLANVFKMFSQQAPALSRSQGGLGIGLSLVKGLVELHGGSVEAKSAGLGKGSEFVVRIPVQAAPSTFQTQDAKRIERKKRPPMRILVVDDNVDHAQSLGIYLEQQGFQVVKAYDGKSALDTALEFKPSVVILDIGLPQLNGYEVARAILDRFEGKKPRLIALTGWGQEQDKQDAFDAGFDYHMTKPVDMDQLDKIIESTFLVSNGS